MRNISAYLFIVGSFIILPLVGFATERVLSVQSLEKSYKTQVDYLDMQIASSTAYLATFDVDKYCGDLPKRQKEYYRCNMKNVQDHRVPVEKQLEQLKEDRRIVEVSYRLVDNAFQ